MRKAFFILNCVGGVLGLFNVMVGLSGNLLPQIGYFFLCVLAVFHFVNIFLSKRVKGKKTLLKGTRLMVLMIVTVLSLCFLLILTCLSLLLLYCTSAFNPYHVCI